MPVTRVRVVCTLGETIDTLAPTRRLTSVDLPEFGAPITAIKPHRFVATPPCVPGKFIGPHVRRDRAAPRPRGARRRASRRPPRSLARCRPPAPRQRNAVGEPALLPTTCDT